MERIAWWVLLALLAAGDKSLKKRHRRLWERTRLPVAVACSVLSLGCAVSLAWGIWDIASSEMASGDKILSCLFFLGCIAAFGAGTWSCWREWAQRRER